MENLQTKLHKQYHRKEHSLCVELAEEKEEAMVYTVAFTKIVSILKRIACVQKRALTRRHEEDTKNRKRLFEEVFCIFMFLSVHLTFFYE